MKHLLILLLICNILVSCSDSKPTYESLDDYPATDANLWLNYNDESTTFRLWSPVAEKVLVHLYEKGQGENIKGSYQMHTKKNGLWELKVLADLKGDYYTFQVQIDGEWLNETPGIYAKAVGVNGKRAMIMDMETSNPENWANDKGPEIAFTNEAIIYELHIRDMTINPESGSSMPGKYLGLSEEGTKGPQGISTGIDHLKEMGITHIHLLPSFDYYSINETKLDSPQFNWGYDPINYNVPEGSFSSNPYEAEVRIKEFKEMVKTFHDNGIGIILDVVYNHTSIYDNSNFNLEVPDYYYRHKEDGSCSDASGCGNETASEREMMREFIIESTKYWAKEYHIDGFRFDLMGIHDITTMNEVASSLKDFDSNIFVYGEGWTAGDSPLEVERRALKHHIKRMPQISAFNDDLRDGLKGSVFEDESTGFVSGAVNTEESIKMGIIGSIHHPQIDYIAVNYSDSAWTNEPWQSVNYVSCHDNHTIYDKLKVSRPDASEKEILAMAKLAQAIVMTSQGTAFMHAGSEMLRTKNEEHNSYNLPDSINQIDWKRKIEKNNMVEYMTNLITLRKQHPAFRMTSARDVKENLEFKTTKSGLVSYQLSNNANGDDWKNIYVIYNAKTKPFKYKLEGEWQVAVKGDKFLIENSKKVKGIVKVPSTSMLILYQD